MAPALGGRAVTAKRGCCLRGKPGLCGLASAEFCFNKSDNDPSEESSLEVESRAGAGAGAGALEGSRRGRFCRPPRASSGLASPSSPPAPPTMSGADSGRTRGAARLMAEHPKAASRIGPDFQVAPASIPPLPGAGAGGAEGGAAPEAAAAPAERSEGAPHAPAPARSVPGNPGFGPGLRLLFAGVVLGRRPPRGSFRPLLGRFAASPAAVSAGRARDARPAPVSLGLGSQLLHAASCVLSTPPLSVRRRAGRFPDLVAAALLHAHPRRADQVPRRRPRPAPAGARRWQEPGAPNPGQDFPRDSARQTALRRAVFVASLGAQQGYSLPPRHIRGRFLPPKTPAARAQKQC